MTRSGPLLLRSARVTLRLHRFELGAAILACLAVAAMALAVRRELEGLELPDGCLGDHALAGDGGVAEACAAGLAAYTRILVLQGEQVFRVSSLLPFVVGVLVAVPIVGRELEAGTAHIAWSLDGSRARWLRRQLWPVALVVALAMATAVVATEWLALADHAVGRPALGLLGTAGLPLLARLVAAFGIGLLTGALIPRTLPALIIGLALCLVLLLGIGQARDAWIDGQAPAARPAEAPEDSWIDTTWAWRAPDGRVLSRTEGSALVPDAVEMGDVGLPAPTMSIAWLGDRGYAYLPMGIAEREAMVWYLYDPLLYLAVGAAATLAAFVVVDRRRPT